MAQWTDPNGTLHNTDNLAYGDQGAISYNTANAINTTVAPQVTAPRAPTVTQSSDSGGAPWAPYPSSAALSAPTAPTGGAPAAPTLNALGRTAADQDAIDRAEARANATAAQLAKDAAITQKLNQDKFDLDKAIADATAAHNAELIRTSDKELADAAFNNNLLNTYRTRQNELLAEQQTQTATYQTGQLANTAQANTSQVNQWGQANMLAGAAQTQTANYQNAQIALTQGQQNIAGRQRRPFRSARIRQV